MGLRHEGLRRPIHAPLPPAGPFAPAAEVRVGKLDIEAHRLAVALAGDDLAMGMQPGERRTVLGREADFDPLAAGRQDFVQLGEQAVAMEECKNASYRLANSALCVKL